MDSASGTHEGQARDELTIVDTIEYTGLIPENEYTVSGALMDKTTGGPHSTMKAARSQRLPLSLQRSRAARWM